MKSRAWWLLGAYALAACAVVEGCGGGDSGGGGPTNDGGADATADSGGGHDTGTGADQTAQDGGGGDTGSKGDATAGDGGGDGSATDGGSGDGSTTDGSGGEGGTTDGGTGDGATGDAAGDGPTGDGSIPCDAVTGNTYYVDPVNGSDGTGSTGSDKAGGATQGTCAFKTIAHALTVIGATAPAGTTIDVLGPATDSGETFPLVVPANVTIQGQGGTVTIDVPATGVTNAFTLNGANSGLKSLTIDGQNGGATGVLVGAGSAATTTLTSVTVQHFATGDGVKVQATGALTLGAGVTLTANQNGLRVTDTGAVTCSNTAAATPVSFSSNTQDGVLVESSGTVTFTGTAGTGGAGSIIATANAAGIVVAQAGPSLSMPLNTLTGVVAWKNTGDGLHLEGGSNVKVRSSYFGGNVTGVEIGASASLSYDTSHIDLGTAAGADAATGSPGLNVLQSPAPTDGGVSAQNTGVGVCFNIPASNASEALYAYGNTWVTAAGASVNCSTSTGTLSISVSCTGGVDLGGTNVHTGNANIGTASCTF